MDVESLRSVHGRTVDERLSQQMEWLTSPSKLLQVQEHSLKLVSVLLQLMSVRQQLASAILNMNVISIS